MGIYVFSADKLYKYLEEDESDKSSSKDFGKDVLPKMLAAGEKMVSYTFDGYWKDVGTINSLFESNMDLLGDSPNFDLSDASWRIRSRSPIAPPHYIAESGRVVNSIVASGCEIEGTVENSILSNDVIIKKGAVVKNSVIFSESIIDENATVDYSIIDEKVKVSRNAKIGSGRYDELKIAVLGRDITVSEGAIIDAGNIIDESI